MTDVIYCWLFQAEDAEGDMFYLADEEFIGASAEADREAKRLADEWEARDGGLILRLELERRGKACCAC